MTIQDSFSRIQYIANLGQTTFDGPANSKIFEDTDVNVYLTPFGSQQNDSVDLLYLNIDYTVTFDSDSFYIDLIVPAAAGDIVTVVRAIPYSRIDDYLTGGTFTGPSMDLNLDRLTAQVEQLRSTFAFRTPLYSISEVIPPGYLVFPKLGPLQLLRANQTGSGLEAVTFEENPDWSTLRSELVNSQEFTDGSRIVGYFNTVLGGSSTVHDALNYIINSDDERPPFSSALDIIKDSVDDTKLLKFNISSIGTGITRTISIPNSDVSLGNSTESTNGLISLATQIETDAGTDDATAVTPLKLKTFIDNYIGNIMLYAMATTTDAGLISSGYGLTVSVI